MSKLIKAAFAAASIMFASAAPANAAVVTFSQTKADGFITGHLVTSEVESQYAGYYLVESVTIDKISYSGVDITFPPGPGGPGFPGVPGYPGGPGFPGGPGYPGGPGSGEPVMTPWCHTHTDIQLAPNAAWYGNWTGYFDPDTGNFRGIRYNGSEEVAWLSYGAGGYSLAMDSFSQPGLYFLGPQHSIAFYDLTFTVLPPLTSGVPEPSAWAMMIAGFGLAGAAIRRRRGLVTRVA